MIKKPVRKSSRKSSRNRTINLAAAGASFLLVASIGHVQADPEFNDYNVPSDEVEVANDLTNAEGVTLRKYGAGTLSLGGSNTYTGATQVFGGRLSLSGSTSSITQTTSLEVTEGDVTVTEGASVLSGSGAIGGEAGKLGTVSLYGDGSKWVSEHGVGIGVNGTAHVSIDSGGLLETAGAISLGVNDGGSGSVWLFGTATMESDRLSIGASGEGNIYVSDGGTVLVTGSSLNLGEEATGVGFLNVSGSASSVTANGIVKIGGKGDGEIYIDSGGNVTSDSLVIGSELGGIGALSVNGEDSSYSVATSATVAASGTGALLVLEGGSFSVDGDLSLASEATGDGRLLISGSGSLATAGAVFVGERGSAVLHIASGGEMLSSGTSIMAMHEGSEGSLLIEGAGSKWVDSGIFGIGHGRAEILVVDGGRLETNTVMIDASVDEVDQRDMVSITVSGAESIWHGTGDISFHNGQGKIVLSDGGVWRSDLGDADEGGTINFWGDGAYTLEIGDGWGAGYLEAKTIAVHGGTFAINFNHTDHNYVFSANVVDAPDLGPYGTIIQSLGGSTILTGSSSVVGVRNAFGAELLVSGSTANLNVKHLGVFEGVFGVMDGATVTVADALHVGDHANAILWISGSHSRLQTANFHVENNADVWVDDQAYLVTSGPSLVGLNGTNSVYVQGNGTHWVAQTEAISLGDITVTNGNDSTDYQGQGNLIISNGGTVRVDFEGYGTGSVILSGTARSNIIIGNAPEWEPTAPGNLYALTITSGSIGGGSVVFNHTDEDYSFYPRMTGDIEVNHYAGRTLLKFENAENDYFGGTFVYGGTLVSGMEGALSENTSLRIIGSTAVYDLNGFNEEAVMVLINSGGSLVNGSLEIDSDAILFDGTLSAVLSGTVGAYKFGDGSVTIENDQLLEGPVRVYQGTLDLVGSIANDGEVYGGKFVVTGTVGGDLSVSGGNAIINGIVEGDVNVTGRGLVSGDGFIAQNLFNAGTVNPGNSPGTLNVIGNYTQSSSGTLEIEIASKTSHDQLVVSGTASLNGKLRIIPKGRLSLGDRYEILLAGGGVEGEFSEVGTDVETLRSFEATYYSNSVVVEYGEETFESFTKTRNLSPNVRSIAKALDKANAKGKLGNLLDTLYSTELSQLPGQLSLLSPEDFAQLYRIGFATAQVQFVNLERRLSDVRNGAIGFSSNGLALSNSRGSLNYDGMPIINERDGLSLAGFDGKSIVGKNVAPIVEQSRWGFFATGSGEWADVESTQAARGSEFTTGGFTIGADYRVSDSFVVGIAGGYAHTGSDLNNGGSINVNSGRGSAYASWFSGGAYLNGAVGGAYNSYETKRGTIGGKARGDTNGGEFDALLGGGYDWRVGGFAIGPIGSLQYTYIGVSGFQESGSSAPLNFSSQSQDSLKSLLGLKASYAWNVCGVVITPEVRAQWSHEYLDSTVAVESGFVGGAGVFTVNSPNIGRDGLLLDAGASVQFSPAVSVFAYYTGEMGRSNYSSNAVNGGFRISF